MTSTSRERLLELVGNADAHVVLVEDIDVEVDVVGGGGDGLLQPREEPFTINQEVEGAVLLARAGVMIQPGLPLGEVHALAAGQWGIMSGGFGERQPHEPHYCLYAQIGEAGHAGNGVLQQRQPVAFHEQRAEALGGCGEPDATLGGVIERGGRQPDAQTPLPVQQKRLGETFGIRRQQHKERLPRVLPHQILLHRPRHGHQGFLHREVTVDDHILGLLAYGGKPGGAVRVTIQEAVGEEPLVIRPVQGNGGSQRLDQIRCEPAPLGSGDDGCLAPAALPLRYAGQLLVPPEQGGTDAIPVARDTMPAPTGVKLLHVGGRLEEETGLVALDEDPGRRRGRGSQAPPLIQRLLFRDCRPRTWAGCIA